MKLTMLATFLVSISAQAADISFQPGTALPAELQRKVNAYVAARCPNLLSVAEDYTVTRLSSYLDTEYSTYLKANYLFDGVHPAGANIVVTSVSLGVKGLEAFPADACN